MLSRKCRPSVWIVGFTFLIFSKPAIAEPIGKWWSGWGQGTSEYGFKNDSAGSDKIYIACGEQETTIRFTVGGKSPPPKSTVFVTIGDEEYTIITNEWGDGTTNCRVCADNFIALWEAIREGQTMWVRYADGRATRFPLAGADKVLEPDACTTDFAR